MRIGAAYGTRSPRRRTIGPQLFWDHFWGETVGNSCKIQNEEFVSETQIGRVGILASLRARS